ncbi:MAG: class I SAM-dependent methyltransferase [Proteobacteria bacterium]|nr:class I SAM-dependent methyltransferase [Pseudomonadota bacterium]
MSSPTTREPQYQCCLDLRKAHGAINLGLMSGQGWIEDPKRLVFVLSRYKFVAKMLTGLGRVAEVGCADAFGTRIVMQDVGHITALDFDPVFIDDARSRLLEGDRVDLLVHDMLTGPVPGAPFEAAFSLDVIEHIDPAVEDAFLGNMAASLSANGVCIIGSPSLESQQYASPPSKAGHINCKSHKDFRLMLQKHFGNVFLFSMNDEVVHTGYAPMAHYLFGLCCLPRRPAVCASSDPSS